MTPEQVGLPLSRAFKEKIKELLEQHGLSQEALAQKLGVKQPAVSYFLNPIGRRHKRAHPIDFFQQIATTFDLPLSQLIAELEARQRAKEGSRRAKVARPLDTSPRPSSFTQYLTDVRELRESIAELRHLILIQDEEIRRLKDASR